MKKKTSNRSAGPQSPTSEAAVLNASIYDQLFPRKPSKADTRKVQILDAAIRTYASLGVAYVSYEDIARTAGISRPLVQHHFPDKKELFLMALKLVRAQLQEIAIKAMSQQTEPIEQFKEYIRSVFYWLKQEPFHARVWLFFFYLCPQEPELKKLHSELTGMGEKRIMAMLALGASKGFFGEGDLSVKAKSIQRVITGALIELETERSSEDIEVVREQVVDLCLLIARSPR